MRHVQGRAGECHIVARTTKQDKVRELQRTLYRAAKADPGRRFHALYDKVHRRDVLERAWELVRANHGAAGIDKQTIADVEEYGVDRLLDELAADLREGRWRPLPARRVFIPKPGREELTTALDSCCSRPDRSRRLRRSSSSRSLRLTCSVLVRVPSQALGSTMRSRSSIDEAWGGRRWVLESDVADCFEAIPHSRLMSAIEERIVDRHILKLLRAMLRAGVMEDQTVRRSDAGTPQGGVISPCLCNVYLHRLDRQWTERGHGVLVRYADDVVVMCQSRQEAERALDALRVILSELGLTLKDAKTRIVELREGGEGLDFLGFHHRWVRGNTPASRHLLLPRSLALTSGDGARPRADPGTDGPPQAAVISRRGRPGRQPLPARLGGLLPLRKLHRCLRQDHVPRACAPGWVHRQASQTQQSVRLVDCHPPVLGPTGADQSLMEPSSRHDPTGRGDRDAECRR